MDAPHDPHNGAAVMRSCDAFGVQELHVVPRNEPFLVSGVVAKGAERWIDVVQHPTPEQAVEALSRRGFELVATHPGGRARSGAARRHRATGAGAGQRARRHLRGAERAAGRSVRIPMRGFVESLNVSVSAAVLLAAATLRAAGGPSGGGNTPAVCPWAVPVRLAGRGCPGRLAPPVTRGPACISVRAANPWQGTTPT